MSADALRALVCQRARQGYAAQLFAGTSGNLSAIDRAAGVVAITPSGLPYDDMTDGDIVLLSPDGAVLEGGRPSSEWPMHLALYRLLPDIGAVVHTHSPYATAFAAAGKPIPAALIEMVFLLGGEVPVAPYAPPGSEALGRAAAGALRDRTACLLKNHGVVAVGRDLPEAYLRAVYAEDAAKICLLATGLGGVTAIPEAEQSRMKQPTEEAPT